MRTSLVLLSAGALLVSSVSLHAHYNEDSQVQQAQEDQDFSRDEEQVLARHPGLKLRYKLHRVLVDERFSHVHIRLKNGVVLVKGFVSNPEDKQELVNRLNKVHGVKSIDNRVEIQGNNSGKDKVSDNSSTPTQQHVIPDEKLARHIQNTLAKTPSFQKYKNVKVDVVDGNVLVQGTVESESDRNTVIRMIEKIRSVKQVDNQLTIEPAHS